jgi:hypothetical protein
MHPIAFGSRIAYPSSLTYRRPGPLRDGRQHKELPSVERRSPPGRGPLGGATRLHQRRPGVRSVSATSRAGPLGNSHRRERFRLEAHPLRGDGSVTCPSQRDVLLYQQHLLS